MDRKKPEIITIGSIKIGICKSMLAVIFLHVLKEIKIQFLMDA
ncbi:hypothetical protein [Borreliella valaisiana]|nr:hypothetical protein [Borreliella valaisiana]